MEITEGDFPQMATLGDRFKAVRKSKKMTQKEFAASLGIVQGFLCSIERGRKIPSDTLLIALQNLYGINADWLHSGIGRMYRELPPASTYRGSTAIPLYKQPPKALDSLTPAMIREYIAVPDIPGDCFAFEYTGEFMAPTIRDGDIIVVSPDKDPSSGDIVLIVGQWDYPFLRRYRKVGSEVICSADNSTYSAFKADANTKFLGVVHTVWRKIKV